MIIVEKQMKGESVSRHPLEPREILLVTLIIVMGFLSEYIDEVVLSKGVPSGPDVFPSWVTHWDVSLLLHINPAIVNPILSISFGLITHVGSTIAILLLCVLSYLLGYKREAVLIFTTIVLGTFIMFPLKAVIMRPRPYSTLSTVVALDYEAGSSFPSGHAERIFALAAVHSKKEREKVLLLYLLATIVAFSRVYLGVHYPLDVFVGSLIGWVIGKATLRWEKKVFAIASRLFRL